MSRVGNFSSSEIHRLMSKGRGNWSLENVGAPFHSYIKEKVRENKLQRPLNAKTNSRTTNWGLFMEKLVFDEIGLDYKLESKTRFIHPEIPKWIGMPDVITRDGKKVGDIKCPWTLTSFCDMADAMADGLEALKDQKPEYYWQIVSNAILVGADVAELIVYVPYKSELAEIKESANMHSYDGDLDENQIAFIHYADDEELPYLLEDGSYPNLISFEFKVPQEDKDLLTARVKMAVEQLEKQLQ